MLRRVLLAAVLACLAADGPFSSEGDALPPVTRGDMTARLTVRVADRAPAPGIAVVVLVIHVEGGRNLQVKEPLVEDPTDAWKRQSNPAVRRDSGQRMVWSQTIVLRQIQPGPAAVPSVRVAFRDDATAAWQQAEWVDILQDVRDAAAPLGPLPEPPIWRRWLPPTAAAAGVLVVVLAAVAWQRRRRPTAPALSPAEQALRDLARLEKVGDGVAADTFYTDLSGVLRRYLEARFGLHAPRQTTAEFLAAVRQAPDVTEVQQALLRGLFERCDLAKFARTAGAADERREAAAQARAFVEQTTIPFTFRARAAPRERET